MRGKQGTHEEVEFRGWRWWCKGASKNCITANGQECHYRGARSGTPVEWLFVCGDCHGRTITGKSWDNYMTCFFTLWITQTLHVFNDCWKKIKIFDLIMTYSFHLIWIKYSLVTFSAELISGHKRSLEVISCLMRVLKPKIVISICIGY